MWRISWTIKKKSGTSSKEQRNSKWKVEEGEGDEREGRGKLLDRERWGAWKRPRYVCTVERGVEWRRGMDVIGGEMALECSTFLR